MSLGAFYSRGTGVKQDYEKSFKCYKAAADQGITQDLRLLISCSVTQNFLLLLIELILRSSRRSRRRNEQGSGRKKKGRGIRGRECKGTLGVRGFFFPVVGSEN